MKTAKSTDPDMKELKEHKLKAYEHMYYSIQRFDLLIVAISSFAILQAFGLAKFTLETKPELSLTYLWFSLLAFVSAIIINLISQLFTYHSNKHEYNYTDEKIKELKKDDSFSEAKKKHHDTCADRFDNWNTIFNYASLSCIVVGVILITLFLVHFI